jgi:hypothetical protein
MHHATAEKAERPPAPALPPRCHPATTTPPPARLTLPPQQPLPAAQHRPREEVAMQLHPPIQDRLARRRLRGVLVWSGLTLLAALAIALALVIATLALELGTEPPPPPTPPIQFSPPGGHQMAQ